MGQILERKKKVARVSGAVLLAGGLVTGAVSGISSFSERRAQEAAERQETMGRLVQGDMTLLQGQGYTVQRQLPDVGSECTGYGTTNENGYDGENTAIAYEVSKNEEKGTVCISRSAAGALVGAFAVAAPPAPEEQPQAEMTPEDVVRTLVEADISRLAQEGFTLEAPTSSDAMGSRCNDDGTTNRTGFNGWTTTISYRARDEFNRTGAVCVMHDRQGKPSEAQFSPSLRR